MPERYAADVWAPSEAGGRYMRERHVESPAFEGGRDGFKPTADAERLRDLVKERTGREFDLRPANSVMARDGVPIWGSGEGFAVTGSGVGYVDPLLGTTYVAAHEAGHAVAPSALQRSEQRNEGKGELDPLSIPREGGARMRYVHENMAKPLVVEEAHAQGFAHQLTKDLGLPGEKLYSNPYEYPESYMRQGLGEYARVEIGPPTAAERKEWRAISRATRPLTERVFRQGQQAAKGGMLGGVGK